MDANHLTNEDDGFYRTSYVLEHPASQVLAPFIQLRLSPCASLLGQAPILLLTCPDANELGPIMLPASHMRERLRRCGIPTCERPEDIKSEHTQWNRYLELRRKQKLSPPEAIDFARLLAQLGFTTHALQLLDSFPEVTSANGERMYYASVFRQLTDPDAAIDEDRLAELAKTHPSPLMQFQVASLVFVRALEVGAAHPASLEVLRGLASSLTGFERHLLLARIHRLEARAETNASNARFQSLVSAAIERAEEALRSARNPWEHFLAQETLRRILDTCVQACASERRGDLVDRTSRRLTEVDPFCGRAWLQRGLVCSQRGDQEDALRCFLRARRLSPLDAAAATAAALKVEGELRRREVLSMELLEHDDFSQAAVSLIEGISPPTCSLVRSVESPISVVASGDGEDSATSRGFQQSEAYRRNLPFWELRESDLPMALAAQSPLLAYENLFRCEESFYFESSDIQRALPPYFRGEVFFAGTQDPMEACRGVRNAVGLSGLPRGLPNVDVLTNRIGGCKDMSVLDRVRLAQLLGAMTLYREGRTVLPSLPSFDKQTWSLSEAWVARADYHLGSMNSLHQTRDHSGLLHAILERLPDAPETLRTRLCLAINGVVNAAHQKRTDQVERFRNIGHTALAAIQTAPQINNFETQILTSRFFRAVSYLPFIQGDRAWLLEEATLCEQFARDAKPETPLQEIIFRENLHPMLESTSRIYSFLGDHDRAMAHMQELLFEVDPCDPKVWLQVGDLLERRKDSRKALAYFVTAGRLVAPMGRISWFRAGRCAEETGELDFALECYQRSLRCDPYAIAPLFRIHDLGRRLGDRVAQSRALRMLHRMKRITDREGMAVEELKLLTAA